MTRTKSQTAQADKLFSLIVRSHGRCQSNRPTHLGNLQCAHGFSRRYRNVRWNFNNAWCLCAGCHTFFTHRPIEWDVWMLDTMGVELYTEVRSLALDTTTKPKVGEILEGLRETWAAVEAAA